MSAKTTVSGKRKPKTQDPKLLPRVPLKYLSYINFWFLSDFLGIDLVYVLYFYATDLSFNGRVRPTLNLIENGAAIF